MMAKPRKLDDFALCLPDIDLDVTVNFRAVDSSNVELVGWDAANNMYVKFTSGAMYVYLNVSRQRAVACAYAASVGGYLNKKVKRRFLTMRII